MRFPNALPFKLHLYPHLTGVKKNLQQQCLLLGIHAPSIHMLPATPQESAEQQETWKPPRGKKAQAQAPVTSTATPLLSSRGALCPESTQKQFGAQHSCPSTEPQKPWDQFFQGNTALATEISVIHAVGYLISFLQVNIFLHYRQQHQLFNASPKNSYITICLIVS